MAIFLGAIIVVLVLVVLFCVFQLCIMNFPWGRNILRDVTSGPLPLFNAKEEDIQRLAKLGFQGLGRLEIKLFWRRQYNVCWYYVDADATTCANVSSYKSEQSTLIIGFVSWFPDNALIETLYPIGERILEPNYISQFVKSDLEAGYRQHQQRIQEWSEQHGTPIVIHDVKQLIPLDQVEIKLHRRRRYRRLSSILIGLMGFSLMGIVVLISVLNTQTNDIMGYFEELLLALGALVICFAGLGFLTRQVSHPPNALDA